VPLGAGNLIADYLSIYIDCEAITVYISIDMQDNDSEITTAALPGKISAETRRPITMATCATQFTHVTGNIDPYANKLNDFSHAFNFPEIRKTAIVSPTCTNTCSTPSDAFTFIDAKSLIIPFASTYMFVTFSPTMGIGAHPLMTIEEATTQLNYKEHFYQGRLSLVGKSPIHLPPDTLFHLLLLALISYEQKAPHSPPWALTTEQPRIY